jgi:23S rRNA (pseudouridine1915-N3)-methyltransferase
MRIVIHAVGKLKAGPERELAERYLDRADKAGRAIGITEVACREIMESRAREALQRKDEEARGLIGDARDRGTPTAVLLIGGPDGHGADLLSRAGHRISFGRLTWPHQIVRILAAEQVYSAVTILSGHPYHRP